METTELRNQVEKAILYLAGVCDGAVKLDGAGFNGGHAPIGHQMAQEIAAGNHLSNGRLKYALEMVNHYPGQLRAAGITVPQLSDINNKPTVKAVLGGWHVTFFGKPKPTDEIYLGIKEIPGRRWLPNVENTPWFVPAIAEEELRRIFPDLPELPENTNPKPTASPAPVTSPAPQSSTRLAWADGAILVYIGKSDFSGDLAKVKSLVERKWEPNLEGKPWKVPGRLVTEVMALFPTAETDPELAKFAAKQIELANMSRQESSDFTVEGLTGTPYPFQRAGAEALVKSGGRMILADEMGLGKTIQAIMYLQYNKTQRPALVVVPASLKINWYKEITKWIGGEKVYIVNGGKPFDLRLTGATIVVINYDVLSKWVETIKTWAPKVMVLDEAHYCKNTKAQRTKAAQALAKVIPSVIPMTGTPIVNRPMELFPLLNMLAPKEWSNFFQFAKRYCDAYQDRFGWHFEGASNLEELHRKMRPYVVRRVKKDVLTELPEKVRSTLVIPFDSKMKAEYDEYIRKAMEGTTEAVQLAEIEKAKQAAAIGKMKSAIEWISSFIEQGEKLVVFATHHKTVDTLMEAFPGQAVKLTGAENTNQRQDAVDRFQNDEQIRLFVGNIKAAGVGITLTAASNVAFVEFGWTPGDHTQAEDRCHRIGQTDSVTAYYLVGEGTIDEDIVSLLEKKRQVVEIVHEGKVAVQDFSILGELINRFKKQYK